MHNELRSAFEITHLFANYSLALSESKDLHIISRIIFFNFYKCIIHYGPNLDFSVRIKINLFIYKESYSFSS